MAHRNGGREVPQPAVCKLEHKESSGIIQLEPKGLKLCVCSGWGSGGVSPGLSASARDPGAAMSRERRRGLFQLKHREQTHPPPFVLFKPSMDWMTSTIHFTVYGSKCSCPETTSLTHPEIVFYQLSGTPQSSQANIKLPFTVTYTFSMVISAGLIFTLPWNYLDVHKKNLLAERQCWGIAADICWVAKWTHPLWTF